MKKISLAVLSFLLSINAFAGNGFDGPYLGAHLGYVDTRLDEKEGLSAGDQTPYWWVDNLRPRGASYGIYGGFNKVLDNNMLIGVEADVEGVSADAKKNGHWAGQVDNGYPMRADYKYAASLRARFGYIVNEGSTLLFVTAGGALARVKVELFNEFGTTATDSNTRNMTGWTLGLGFEQLLSPNLSLKAEYRYTDYESYRLHNTNYCGTGCYDEIKSKSDALRVGVHYRF